MPQTGHPGLWQEEMRSGTEAKERHGTPTSLKRHTSDKESPLQQLCYNHNVHQPTVLDPQRGHPSALLVSGREQDVRGGLPGISSPRPLPRPAGSSGSRVPSPQVGRLGSCTCSQGPEGRVLQGGVSGAEEAQDLYPGQWCWGRGGGGVHQGVFRPRMSTCEACVLSSRRQLPAERTKGDREPHSISPGCADPPATQRWNQNVIPVLP